MTVKNIYVAEDGTEFRDKTACEQYEFNLKERSYARLADYIVFYKANGTIVPYSAVAHSEYCAYFAYIKQMPYDEEIDRLWYEVVPEELNNVADDSGSGWYWLNNCDHWTSFKRVETDYLYCKNKIELFENKG